MVVSSLHHKIAASMAKRAADLKVKPNKKQVEADWKEDLARMKTREGVATLSASAKSTYMGRDARIRAAAERIHENRQSAKQDRGTLTLSRRKVPPTVAER
jgi:hypothetical protein